MSVGPGTVSVEGDAGLAEAHQLKKNVLSIPAPGGRGEPSL